MNYFEKVRAVEDILGGGMLKSKSHSYALLFDYAERLVLSSDAGKKIEKSNPFRADFAETRKITNARFFIKTALYALCRSRGSHTKSSAGNLLLSYNLNHRFSNLSFRFAETRKCFLFATRTNILFSRKFSNVELLKCDDIFYSSSIGEMLSLLTGVIRQAVEHKVPVDWPQQAKLLEQLELELNIVTDKLATLLRTCKIDQYITPFSSRYEDILICLACKKEGIVSKEICHGVNSQNLQSSDNVVPTFADYLYVWNRQFYDNISAFGDMERVRICGYPKYSKDEAQEFAKRYKQQPMITYFSQPTQDIGASGNERITEEFAQNENRWRRELFEVLHDYSRENNVQIRVRYHQGEKGAACDRSQERARLAEYGFSFSTGPLEQDLFQSSLCLGINTSVLYEAHVLGRNVLQVYFARTGETNYHNTVQVVRLTDLKSAITAHFAGKKPIVTESLMNLEDFLAN